MERGYLEAKQVIEWARKILIISHKKPDPDTLGAAIALRIWLGKLGKSVTLACVDVPSSTFNFLPHLDEYVDSFELKDFNLLIIVDAGASHMTNFHLKYENLFQSKVPILNIDHHASNDFFGNINIVDPKAASATVVLYRFFDTMGVEIDADMATCLLAGIYADTGSFMHSNTDGEVYAIASVLVELGANVSGITKSLFRSKSLAMLKLWGRVLEKSYVTDDKVVMSIVKDDDYEQIGSGPEGLSGVVDYLNMVPDTKFAVLINEDRKGNVKGSFRTRQSTLDLSRIAAQFGGGGHSKASGFMLPGKVDQELKFSILSPDFSKKSLEFSIVSPDLPEKNLKF